MMEIRQIRESILSDRFLSYFYETTFRRVQAVLAPGLRNIEIGSGSGIGKIFLPSLTCTEVEPNEFVPLRVDGSALPWPNSSIDNIILVNAFHHLPFPSLFLSEAARTLTDGGRIALVEPYWGLFAALIYSFIHPEPFRPFDKNWDNAKNDPWASNQALAWIVFKRDRKLFEKRFPELKICGSVPFSGVSYLLSGGVFHRSRVPSEFLISLAEWEQKQKSWFLPLRLFSVIWVEKKVETEK